MKKLRVTVEGKAYEVTVELLDDSSAPAAPRPAAVAAPVLAAPVAILASAAPVVAKAANTGDSGAVTSPLAGKVVSIDVKLDQTVEEGIQIATVEAMKMNTYVYAPKTGVISAILVNPGDGVEEGATLLRIS